MIIPDWFVLAAIFMAVFTIGSWIRRVIKERRWRSGWYLDWQHAHEHRMRYEEEARGRAAGPASAGSTAETLH